MRRPRLLTALAVGTLTLGVVVGVGWERSFRASEAIGVERYRFDATTADSAYRSVFIGNQRGKVAILFRKRVQSPLARQSGRATPLLPSTASGIPDVDWRWEYGFLSKAPLTWTGTFIWPQFERSFIGFGIRNHKASQLKKLGVMDEHLSDLAIGIPHWALLLVCMILPWRWLVRYRRERREAAVGLCPVCGYDLRASPDRCPECGTPNTNSTIPEQIAHQRTS